MAKGDSVESQDSDNPADPKKSEQKPAAWVAKKQNAFWKAIAMSSIAAKKEEVVKQDVKKKEVEIKTIAQKLRKVQKAEADRPKLKEWRAKRGNTGSPDIPASPANEKAEEVVNTLKNILGKKKRTLPGQKPLPSDNFI